jgi:hypothetical protein
MEVVPSGEGHAIGSRKACPPRFYGRLHDRLQGETVVAERDYAIMR